MCPHDTGRLPRSVLVFLPLAIVAGCGSRTGLEIGSASHARSDASAPPPPPDAAEASPLPAGATGRVDGGAREQSGALRW
jgi:hypothetical protein